MDFGAATVIRFPYMLATSDGNSLSEGRRVKCWRSSFVVSQVIPIFARDSTTTFRPSFKWVMLSLSSLEVAAIS